jgi:transcriptional regulator with XRE-family HTH domain
MSSPDLLYREFGLLLASARRRRRFSQSKFGSLVGLSRTSITNIECGRQRVLLHQVFVFASVLNTPVSMLLPKDSWIGSVGPVISGESDAPTKFLQQVKKAWSKAYDEKRRD